MGVGTTLENGPNVLVLPITNIYPQFFFLPKINLELVPPIDFPKLGKHKYGILVLTNDIAKGVFFSAL